MQMLLNLYKSLIIPALIYGCETWVPTTEEKSKLKQIQLSASKRILKISTSTLLVVTYIETGELPIISECEKRQLTYLWVLLHSENQIKDILDIQLKEYKSNTCSLAKHLSHLLNKFDIKESLSYVASLTKIKWKKLLHEKLVQLNNDFCTKNSINLSKLTTLNKYKKEPKREQYIKSSTRSESSIIF